MANRTVYWCMALTAAGVTAMPMSAQAVVPPPPSGSGLTYPAAQACLETVEEPDMDDDYAITASQGLQPEAIRLAMNGVLAHTGRCINGDPPSGILIAEVKVSCTGQVDLVRVKDDANWENSIANCVASALWYADFPAHGLPSGETFEFPVQFVADGTETASTRGDPGVERSGFAVADADEDDDSPLSGVLASLREVTSDEAIEAARAEAERLITEAESQAADREAERRVAEQRARDAETEVVRLERQQREAEAAAVRIVEERERLARLDAERMAKLERERQAAEQIERDRLVAEQAALQVAERTAAADRARVAAEERARELEAIREGERRARIAAELETQRQMEEAQRLASAARQAAVEAGRRAQTERDGAALAVQAEREAVDAARSAESRRLEAEAARLAVAVHDDGERRPVATREPDFDRPAVAAGETAEPPTVQVRAVVAGLPTRRAVQTVHSTVEAVKLVPSFAWTPRDTGVGEEGGSQMNAGVNTLRRQAVPERKREADLVVVVAEPENDWPEPDPRLVVRKRVLPEFPPALVRVHGHKPVECTAVVDVNQRGEAARVAVVDCPVGLHLEAASAVNRWKWEPVTDRGLPIDVRTSVVFGFKQSKPAKYPGYTFLTDPRQITADPELPVLIRSGELPPYPEQVSGGSATCKIDLVVTRSGEPRDYIVDGCARPYRKVTEVAVRGWHFTEPNVDGQAVEMELSVQVDFEK